MESNYCGFIEVWKDELYTFQCEKPYPIGSLRAYLKDTMFCECKTVAIFKIKLKQKTNEAN